jgi:3-oxoacyl-[acyl-carrier protein] reductase
MMCAPGHHGSRNLALGEAHVDLGLKGRTAAVAAASKGLGFATAAALAAEGARVAICGRDAQRIGDAAARIGMGTVGLMADVATEEGATRFVREAEAALGPIDILVPNAGGPPPGNFASTEIAAYLRAIDLNLISTIALCRAAVPGMRQRRFGRVVAITSHAVRQPSPFLAASVTARAGVTGFLKVLAREVAADGVTVNSLQPGAHATDRLKGLGVSLEQIAKTIPVGFVGSAEDFGKLAAVVCSDFARFMTGTTVLIDGGAYDGLI